MLRVFKAVIETWTDTDIYAVSFYVEDYCDNPCEPTVKLGYNTERQYISAVEKASDKEEARWNFAYWLQNSEFVYGENETKGNVADWIIGNEMPYFPCVGYSFNIPNNVDDASLSKITSEFVKVLVDIVKELRKTRFIKKKFGKHIPIIIHELEYYEQIAEQNIVANSLPVVRDFVKWIRSM